MKTLHLFKIKEDSVKFDIVEFIHDEVNDVFIVRWKWSTMKTAVSNTFRSFIDADAKYLERKQFAISCCH